MNWDALFVAAVWVLFLFVWLPRSHLRYRERMRSLLAINKGYRFTKKYEVIRKLTGGRHEP